MRTASCFAGVPAGSGVVGCMLVPADELEQLAIGPAAALLGRQRLVLARIANQRAQLLQVGARVLAREARRRRVGGDQLGAPALRRDAARANRGRGRAASRRPRGESARRRPNASACRSAASAGAAPRGCGSGGAREWHRTAARKGRGPTGARRSSRATPRRAPAVRATRPCGASCSAARTARSIRPKGLGQERRRGGRGGFARGRERKAGGRGYDSRRPSARPSFGAAPRPLSPCPPRTPLRFRPPTSPTTRERFRELVDDALATARALGASDAVAEVSEGVGPVGFGAQGRDRERRAQPRQVVEHHRLRRPAARQRQHLRFLARRPRADGAGRLGHRPLHGRRPGRRPARSRRPRDRRRREARPRSFPSLADRCRRRDRARDSNAKPRRSTVDRRITNSEGAGVSAQQSHFYAAQHARLRRRLRQLAPFALRRADRLVARQVGRRHAARRLVHLDARRRASWPRRPRSAATPPSARCRASARARSRPARCRCCSNRRWPRACSAPTCRPRVAVRCTASRRSSKAASASRSSPTTSTCTKIRTSRAARAARRSTTRAC